MYFRILHFGRVPSRFFEIGGRIGKEMLRERKNVGHEEVGGVGSVGQKKVATHIPMRGMVSGIENELHRTMSEFLTALKSEPDF